jgi:hypothetical protein
MNTKAIIARVLYEIDPMNIGTVENELYDEYENEARVIARQLEDDVLDPRVRGVISFTFLDPKFLKKTLESFDFESSVRGVFDFYFWEGCLTDEKINKICTALKNSVQHSMK